MLGRDDDYVSTLERAYQAHLKAGAPMSAVRCTFWIGHSWLFRGQAAPAFGWFAEARGCWTMVAVTSGELSPIVAGIVYCNTIAFCRGVHQLHRVQEWTVALTR